MLNFRKYQPAQELKNYVEYYFEIEKGGESSTASDFMTNHPKGTFDLMFALNSGVSLTNYKNDRFELGKIFLMAQQEGFFKIKFHPDVYVFGVVFYAESFSKLFNLPLDE